ncbi:class I adenylate-forming enzyme family protein [Natronobeatus ordinarius]|uniref:class I adenylate-forming enzyme family protein n=1 Tax=Natronobeatus ordinarius TaxID=2963433 RepID=UPI0020CC67B0|nr:AMP-binding protein [Natronobeatus ordinarius]
MSAPVDWPTRDLVTHRAKTTPGDVALIDADAATDADDRWSFREYSRHVDHTAAGLADHHGGRIGVLIDTRPAFASLFFAAMRTGSTLVPLNLRETPSELAAKVDRTALEAVVCESSTERAALELTDRPVYSVDEPECDGVRALYRSSSTTTVEPALLERTRTQLLMFTSGTSGTPKIVRLSVGNLVSSATASAFRLGVSPDDRWLCCLPMYHMGGLAPVVRSALYGTAVVVQRAFDPEETARAMDEHAITGVSLVPTTLERLLEAGWSPPDTLRFVLLGGAPATEALLERARERGVPVCPTYGMTEAASQIATATPGEAADHPGTVGRPLAFTDVTIVDETGEPVGPGETGELVVSGPTVTPGYLDDEHTTAAFGEHGLHTGDAGYRDEAGRLWVGSRLSDRIVTGGENVDPDEVVEALCAHPGIETAAVVGLPDPEWGERVSALVVPTDRVPSLEVLLAHCDDRLAGFKRPKTVGFADELPRTPSGTVDREAVKARLEADGIDATNRA